MNIDEKIISIPHVAEQLIELKSRFKDETEYVLAIPYLQYNIPLGELYRLVEVGPFDKKWREFNPLNDTYTSPTDDMSLFKNYVNNPAQVLKHGYSFAFYGANGSGKTMLALWLLTGFIEKGYKGYYIHFKDYMTIFNEVNYNNNTALAPLLKHIKNCSLLVLDEVGKEPSTTPNVLGEIELLLKHRTTNSLPTIIVTNLEFDANGSVPTFANRYGNSVNNLMLDKYRYINFSKTGEYRIKMRGQQWEL